MIDLTTIDQDTIIARGQYATVRAAHEDEKKRLSILCGQLSSAASQVLKYMQPPEGDAPVMGAVLDLIDIGRSTLDKIEKCAREIDELDTQRKVLKQAAWNR